jgi:hypothetical protein
MATEGTKFQINYKLNDGTLINLYAASTSELEAGLADLAISVRTVIRQGKRTLLPITNVQLIGTISVMIRGVYASTRLVQGT